ncbi:MAG: tetratricopeptide repeat protein [Chthoniobacterales bacterium]|nr:tetratricopeptide repeat protein [Chthoniobacterales bacterium]
MVTGAPPKHPALVERDEKALTREIAGDAAAARNDSREALSCWGEGLDIFVERAMAAPAARVASKIATLEESLGENEAACAHYEQAIEFYRKARDTQHVPMCLNNLGMLRKQAGDLEEAAVLLARAMSEAARHEGDLQTEMALIATNLGAVLCECGDLLGAEKRHMEALGILEQLYGTTHPEIGLSLGHLAVIYHMRGEEKKAKSFYTAALAILDEFPGLHEAEREILQQNLSEL